MWKYLILALLATTAFCEEKKWSLGCSVADPVHDSSFPFVLSLNAGYQVTAKARITLELVNDVLSDDDLDTSDSFRGLVSTTSISLIYDLREPDKRVQPFIGLGVGRGKFGIEPANYWADHYRGLNPKIEWRKTAQTSLRAGVEVDLIDRWETAIVLRHAQADDRNTTSLGIGLRFKF